MKTILFVETNSAGNGTQAMLAAQAAGYRAHFLAANPEEYERHEINPLLVADEVTHVDTFDVPKMLRIVDGRTDYAAVLAYDELRVVQAALLGSYLGLRHNPPVDAMVRVRFKDRMRHALSGTRWSVRHTVLPLADMSPDRPPMPYPFVVKPLDEAASVGVRVCRDPGGFADAVAGLRHITARRNSRGYQRLGEVLVEELLDGDEYSAELVWDATCADWVLIGFTAKIMSLGPSCVETGYVFPHWFGDGIDDHIVAELRDCLDHLGLHDTMAHVEFRYAAGQVRLIEVNPRPAGGAIPQIVGRVASTGLIDLHLAAHLGGVHSALATVTLSGYAGALFVVPDRAGTVVGLEPAPQDIDGVVSFRQPAFPRVVQAGQSNEDRLGYLVVQAATRGRVESAIRHARRIRPVYASTEPDAGRLAATGARR
jgi:hypothetical protein